MKTFLIIISVVLLLIITASVLYYFIIYRPSTDKEKIELQKQEGITEQTNREKDCEEIGIKDYDEYKKQNSGFGYYFFKPEFYFNEELDACIYSGGIGRKDWTFTAFIKNLDTDEEIISVDTALFLDYTDEEIEEKLEEYDLMRAELFHQEIKTWNE